MTHSIVGFRAVSGVLAAASLFISGQSAFANAANTDIATPLRAAQGAEKSVSGGEDEQFKKLFSSWQNFEETGHAALAASTGRSPLSAAARAAAGIAGPVSIPSRTPLNGLTMTSNFGMRVHPVLGGMRAHKGVDLSAPVGTPIYATADGVVGKASWFGGYGLYVQLEHGNDLETRYGHMSRLAVAEGQHIHKGDVLGYVGTTGRSTGPHLHYEVRVNGVAVNPIPYMQQDRVSLAASGK
ncbi:murein DD-endopeptidase MepM/ murein hydrolase activator NlpD [Novosphingobium fluoreni]|uniref:Murein DD-endopeptidase MepM/ murein hydrolase activator NlpD n=1 Tax=Novosphingobium fluoreni TaxID=1391222 RepID=A0A7W6FX32_9SPHN|nr:murein DD-endopeptidase MepM/ murein hydrolase activator NlpD [Novosphingobium fluoreni]